MTVTSGLRHPHCLALQRTKSNRIQAELLAALENVPRHPQAAVHYQQAIDDQNNSLRSVHIAAAQEQFLVLQDWNLDASGYIIPPTECEKMHGREDPLITVSGRLQPSLFIKRNGLLRLRNLNASVSRFYR